MLNDLNDMIQKNGVKTTFLVVFHSDHDHLVLYKCSIFVWYTCGISKDKYFGKDAQKKAIFFFNFTTFNISCGHQIVDMSTKKVAILLIFMMA